MLTRRSLLKTGAAGLVVGFGPLGCEDDPPKSPGASTTGPTATASAESGLSAARGVELGGYVRIGSDDTVTLVIAESEMGQGVLTGLAMVLAEELGADWTKVRAEHAPSNPELYGKQATGGSTSVRQDYDPLRRAGATARAMLVAAAAKRWKVPAEQCRVVDGVVRHEQKRLAARFGELAASAAEQPRPAQPELRDPRDFRRIGKPTRRLDGPAKARGEAVFGMDVTLPGLLVAQVARPPVFGGKLRKLQASAAEAIEGVRKVVALPAGVAVVADHFWAAQQGRDALKVEWDDGGHGQLSSAEITERSKQAVAGGVVARNDGDVAEALERPGALRAVYEAPLLAHAPMELLNATAHVQKDRCDVWAPTQAPTRAQEVAAEITGLPKERVHLRVPFIGCGFGRRVQTDFVAEAVHASKAVGRPVKVVWPREDDVRGGYYRPSAYNEMAGRVEAEVPVAWQHQIAGPSIFDTMGRKTKPGEAEYAAVGGAADLPYDIPNVRVTYAKVALPIPVGYWRSVAYSQNGFVTECFFDELAAAAQVDPFELRRKLLGSKPRLRAVLERAADAAGWGKPLGEGRARGIAAVASYGSFVAQVAEVSVEAKRVRVHRVTCAVDCGQVVNPLSVEAQMESGIIVGLSAALYGRIDIAEGRAVQGNFDDYRILDMASAPRIDTILAPSGDGHGGIGEPAVPVIAPAVCNALFALTGKPIRRLPIELG